MNGWDKLNENIKRILDKINIKSSFSLKPLVGILECEKYLVKDSLLYYHGHIYKVERIGIIKSGKSDYEHGALLIDILNASNNRVLSFRHLSDGDFYLIKLDTERNIPKKLTEEKMETLFQIPDIIKDNFKITNSLKDANKWEAKIIENNSNGDESIGIGDWDNIGYVMISLKDNTIIPIARADEHKTGYEVLHDVYQEKYNINASNYYSVFCIEGGSNYPYSLEEAELLKQALIKCKSYGMDLTKSYVYMTIINSMYRNKSYNDSFVTSEDFINGNFSTEEKANAQITNLGQKLIQAFKLLSESFSTTNIHGKYSIANINKAIKNLYNIGSKIMLKDNFKLVGDNDLEQMLNFVQQYKEGYYSNSQISKAFFGFLGFRNNFHQRLRKNIDNKMLEKQLGSIQTIIEMIGNI